MLLASYFSSGYLACSLAVTKGHFFEAAESACRAVAEVIVTRRYFLHHIYELFLFIYSVVPLRRIYHVRSFIF
jgi:hypothetical protein